MAKSKREQEEDQIMFQSYDDMVNFLDEKTNVTMLKNSEAEADDMIALFIAVNELIVIKNELKILVDAKGMPRF